VDFTLTPEQELIRQTAREFSDREIAPHARDWDRAEEMSPAIVAKLAGVGFLAAALPEEVGGMGLDTVSYALVVEEIGRADSSVRGIVSVSNGLYGKTVARWGNETQRRELLEPLAAGEALGCYALTEPGVGSDPGSLETRAARDGDGWVLSGQKIFITLGTWAAFALVFARTGEPGPRGITCFVVPTDAPGF
jgi:alkylation response protein AidB-like acyl-CoA dehydrogenase